MNEKYCDLPFYNMQIHFLEKGAIRVEEAAIKNIWQKDTGTFFDIYIYRQKKSQVLDISYIRSIINLNNNKSYVPVKEVISDFFTVKNTKPNEKISEDKGLLRAFREVKDDIVILSFIAKCDGELLPIKVKAIEDYIIKVKPDAKFLSDNYLKTYITNLSPNENDFYQAMENIKSKSPQEALNLVREAVKISTSDGYFDYYEKLYVAELIQVLREFGVSLKLDSL
ncbi:MAG: TerB family tellurite resistance protein [Alphaproteobacteria bacterium]|nr:TerB family tellurite resistance protein [Alphaproteobacteria bacterium]